MNQLSLNLRIILLVLVTSGALVGGMLITVNQLLETDYAVLVAERESAEIERLAADLELSQRQRVLGLEAFATRLMKDDGQVRGHQEIHTLLQQPSVASDLFPDGLLFFDASATAVAESKYVPGRLGTNYADRPHFQRAMQTRSAVVSEPILGRASGLPLISFLQPMLSSSGDIIGYAGGILDLSNTPLLSRATSDVIESNSITLIIDPRYQLFVSMEEQFTTPESIPAEGTNALVDAAMSMSPAGTRVQHQQAEYLIATKQLDGLGWVVLRAIPYADAIAPAQASYRYFLLIALFAIVLIGLVGMRVARNLTKPIVTMTDRIQNMTEDARFDSDFPEQGGPEVTALAQAMNRLANERKAADIAIRTAEQFLFNVLEAASEISIIATDCNGYISAFNKGAENMLGYSRAEMVAKQTPLVLHLRHEVESRAEELSAKHGRSVKGFRVFVETAEQQGSESMEWTYVRKDGGLVPVRLVVTLMHDADGDIIGYLGIAEDITDRKRMDQMKSEFISTVSHELRTPLTSISGALSLMVGGAFGELPDKAQKMLMTADRNSKRLSHLINDLLDIEKITVGKMHYDMQTHFLMPLLSQALEVNRHYGSERDVHLLLTGNAPDARVHIDSQRLMQVLSNLLSNAIKFSPMSDVVTLNVHVEDKKVIVSVSDNGPGIADSFRSRIFQRFAQADSSDTRAKEGTGLGLAITRELLERMGGIIDYESILGNGSRFFFELPLVQDTNEIPNEQETSNVDRNVAQILVVEDDPDVAHLLSILLQEAGYHVDIALDGRDAFNRLQQFKYDLVSLDLGLPDMNGLEIIHKLRQHSDTADLPIIVVSAKVEHGQLEIIGDVTHIEWLAKPIDQQHLVQTVTDQLLTKYSHQARILHVEDDADLHEVICAMAGTQFTIEAAFSLSDARTRLKQQVFDVILLDISLPDGSGWDLLPEIRSSLPDAKVIILSGDDISRQDYHSVEAVMLKSRLSKEILLDGISARIQLYRSGGSRDRGKNII